MPDSDDRLTDLRLRWEADPGSRVFVQLAEEYRGLGRLDEAVQVLESGLAKAPSYVSAQVALGRCRLELGNIDSAVSVLERVVERDSTQLVANKLLVEAYLRRGDLRAARERLELYAALNDADPQIEELREALREAEARSVIGEPEAEEGLLMAVGEGAEGTTQEPPAEAARPKAGSGVFEDLGAPVASPVPPSPPAPLGSLDLLGSPASVRPTQAPPSSLGDPFPDLHRRDDLNRYEVAMAAEGLFPSGAKAISKSAPVAEEAPEAPEAPQAPEASGQAAESAVRLEAIEPVLEVAPTEERIATSGVAGAASEASPPLPFDLEAPTPGRPDGDQIFDLPPVEVAASPSLDLASPPVAPVAPVVTEPEEPVFAELAPEPEAAVPAVDHLAKAFAAPADEALTHEAPSYETPGSETPDHEIRDHEPAEDEHEVETGGELAELDLENQPVTATLGQLYLQQGHPEVARQIFRKVLAQEPGHPVALAGLATIEKPREPRPLTAAELLRGAGTPAAAGLTDRKIVLLKSYLRRLKARG